MSASKKHLACIFGTRPEAIKMAPIIRELLKNSDRFKVSVICTGQHRELLTPLIDWFEIPVAVNMNVMAPNQDLNTLSSRLLAEFGRLFSEQKFDGVIAQGDTTSVFTSAIASFHNRLPFFHVEAGLRTYDMNFPFPEEMNRVVVGRVASQHFAPTEQAAQNLLAEKIDKARVHTVGNTVIDALNYTNERLQASAHPRTARNDMILITAHRRENFGEPLTRICKAIRRLAEALVDVTFVFPVHPNPNVRAVVDAILAGLPNLSLIDPVPYPQMVDLLRQCRLVLTDSGGLQEEAPALGKPVLVLRDETERPELVAAGGSILVGASEDLIYATTMRLLSDPSEYQKMVLGYSPYGDGQAAIRIVNVVDGFFDVEAGV